MTHTDSDVRQLLDTAAIRDAIARFADAATLANLDAFRALWADDAEWTIGEPLNQVAEGIDEIASMITHLWAPNEYFVQIVAPPVVEIEGDQATARGLVHEEAKGPNGRFYRNNGVSHDRLKRSGETWVFTSRRYEFLWLDFSEFGGDTFMSFPQITK
jgi:hypothetical protein